MKRPRYKYALAVLDLTCIFTGFVFAFEFHWETDHLVGPGLVPLTPTAYFLLLYCAAMIPVFQHNNLYKINVFLTTAMHTVRIAVSLVYAVIGLALLSWFTKSPAIPESRFIVLTFFLSSLVMLIVFRVGIFRWLFLFLARTSIYKRRVLILGAGSSGRTIAAALEVSNPFGLQILGFLDDHVPQGERVVLGLRSLGAVSTAVKIIAQHNVEEVIIALEDVTREYLANTLEFLRPLKLTVRAAAPTGSILRKKVFLEQYGDLALVNVNGHPEKLIRLVPKRIFDLVLASITLLLLSPLFLIIAAAIRVDSKGPVVFKQVRLGKNGKPFTFFKFRSMPAGAEGEKRRVQQIADFIKGNERGNGSTKIVDDSKITRIGKFLRKTSFDELPQLFNVLKGDMSLVGPRPCLPYEWEFYEPWHKERLSVTPGCTGIWQVHARSEVGFEDMVVLDLYYINHATTIMDLALILKTLPVMLLGKGGR